MVTKRSARKQAPLSAGRLGSQDWVDATFRRIVHERGVQGAQLNRIADDLGVTNGSFYWHFRNRTALLDLLFDRWRRTTIRINALEPEELDPESRLRKIFHMPSQLADAVDEAKFETPLRTFARRSPRLGAVAREVDAIRIESYKRVVRRLGASGQRAASRNALIEEALVMMVGAARSQAS